MARQGAALAVLAALFSLVLMAPPVRAGEFSIRIEQKCQPQGTSLAWAGRGGVPVPCPGAMEWSKNQVLVPDQGATVLISGGALTLGEDLIAAADPWCVLGNLSHRTDINGKLLISVTPAGATHYAVLCAIPPLVALRRSVNGSAEVDHTLTVPLNISLQRALPSFRAPTSRLSYFSVSSVSPALAPASAAPSSIITILGANLVASSTANSPPPAAAACSFTFASVNASSSPPYLPEMFRGDARAFLAPAVSYPPGGVACALPPLPPGLEVMIGASATPSLAQIPASVPIPFLLIAPRPMTVSVGRSTLAGGFNITVSGE
ncbi:hypothetical protein T484DRAFT_1900673, partial [Baffinella frigidus]